MSRTGGEAGPRRTRPIGRIDVSGATFVRALAALAFVWLWLMLWQWVLVFLVAVFLAIALEPVVEWLGGHGIRRRYAAPLLGLVLALALVGFLVASGASLAAQARTVGGSLRDSADALMAQIPPELKEAVATFTPSAETLSNLGRALVAGAGGVAVALVITVYLLLDGRRTYEWFVAFVPAGSRPKVHETAASASEVIAAYVRGNLLTSALAGVFTWVALAVLQVPAAFLLALLAGVFDLLPVVGFFLSAVPAVLLGFTVSPTVGLAVAGFYFLYNAVENYYIVPKIYGRELSLTDLAVVAAFLVGAELGGVLGAIVALPIAAIYPSVERIWLRDSTRPDVPRQHRRIEAQAED